MVQHGSPTRHDGVPEVVHVSRYEFANPAEGQPSRTRFPEAASDPAFEAPDMNSKTGRSSFATDRETLEREALVEPYRAPGPGGQRKNRKETAVRVTHPPSGIVVVASERRSQAQNREIAFERLIKKLTKLNRPRKRRIPTRPSAGAIRKQKEDKENLSQKKRLRLKSSASREMD